MKISSSSVPQRAIQITISIFLQLYSEGNSLYVNTYTECECAAVTLSTGSVVEGITLAIRKSGGESHVRPTDRQFVIFVAKQSFPADDFTSSRYFNFVLNYIF